MTSLSGQKQIPPCIINALCIAGNWAITSDINQVFDDPRSFLSFKPLYFMNTNVGDLQIYRGSQVGCSPHIKHRKNIVYRVVYFIQPWPNFNHVSRSNTHSILSAIMRKLCIAACIDVLYGLFMDSITRICVITL